MPDQHESQKIIIGMLKKCIETEAEMVERMAQIIRQLQDSLDTDSKIRYLLLLEQQKDQILDNKKSFEERLKFAEDNQDYDNNLN